MVKHSDPLSPITRTSNVKLEQAIESRHIIKLYRTLLDIDVEEYFNNIEFVYLYRCLDTDYRFYFPFNLEGDSRLYESLSRLPSFYLDWKWEYEVANDLIQEDATVLEIGSGKGAFIEHLTKKGVNCTGLEINNETLTKAKENGINIIGHSIQEHALLYPQHYDVVCYFQVLEHIADIHDFIKSSVDALKIGGKLIIGVPNNGSFIKYDKLLPTNMPPHHMGLWNKTSLKRLEKFFNLELDKFYFQKLQEQWEYEWYYRTQLSRIIGFFGGENKFLSKVTYKTSALLPLLTVVKYIGKYINNHTILAIYEKRG